MGQTIAEKILSRTVGKAVKAGDEEVFFPDLIVAYDYPGYIDKYESQMENWGSRA
jgi:3-isopropylmalate/(R)-2-methylmalate dehydratase large subunit